MSTPDQTRPGAACALCGGALRSRPAVRLDHYNLMTCGDCSSWILTPRPSAAEQTAFHDDEAYFDHPYLVYRRAFTEANERRAAAVIDRIRKAGCLRAFRGGRVLDVGCDTGQFVLSVAGLLGGVPVGVDVARRAVGLARAKGVEAYHSTLEDAPAHLSDFPLVTAIDLIEHVADPRQFFRALADRLCPGGVVYVETPNMNSGVYRSGRRLCSITRASPIGVFRRLFPPEHVQYYSRAAFDRVAAHSGLHIVALGSRVLPAREIAVGWATRLGLIPLQAMDHLTGDKALIWAVLQRP
jgi:2-polyprenyl-3-methyl-5-hydroxy-6-metoxy-1,4-benzoquinol methylase